MFLDFFHTLRRFNVPVTLTEWLTLLEALEKGLHRESLEEFYYLSRCLLVKDVGFYDAFDQAFVHCFKDAALPPGLFDPLKLEAILTYLRESEAELSLSEAELARMESLPLAQLLEELEERMRRQAEPHVGGQKQIGTGGTSPFGAAGSHPSGASFDPEGGGGRAAMVGVGRKYRNLRNDLTLDVRQIGVALKRLRDLRDLGAQETLDLEETIDKSCRNCGEIDLVFARQRENQIRLMLLMDSGGSMEPYRILCERLFSAAHGLNHFKDFRAFYFHNCVYENLYTDLSKGEFVPTLEVIREYGRDYRLVVVGDAAMSPAELLSEHGTLETFQPSHKVKGIDWLRQLGEAFSRRVWMNPLPESAWVHYETVASVERHYPMYPLTLDGLGRAVKLLR